MTVIPTAVANDVRLGLLGVLGDAAGAVAELVSDPHARVGIGVPRDEPVREWLDYMLRTRLLLGRSFGKQPVRLQRQIEAAAIAADLTPIGVIPNEAVARELAPLIAEASAFTGRGEVFLRALIACGALPATDGPDGPLVTRNDLLGALGSSYDPAIETRQPVGFW